MDTHIFAQAQRVVEALRGQNCREALSWCAENKSKLKRIQSNLEFKLRVQEFIQLVRKGCKMEAIAYARRYLSPWAGSEMEELQRAMATLAFKPETTCYPYVVLFDPSQWERLTELFLSELYRLHNLTPVSLLQIHLQVTDVSTCLLPAPLDLDDRACRIFPSTPRPSLLPSLLPPFPPSSLFLSTSLLPTLHDNLPDLLSCFAITDLPSSAVFARLELPFPRCSPGLIPPLLDTQAGLSALKTNSNMDGNCNKEDPLSLPEFRQLAAGLPLAKHGRSKLVCSVTKEMMNEHNPPMVLPNNYVYSQKAVEQISARNGGKMVCPVTGKSPLRA